MYGEAVKFDSQILHLPLREFYILRSGEENFLGKPELYSRQMVLVSRVWLDNSGSRSMTVEEREAELKGKVEEGGADSGNWEEAVREWERKREEQRRADKGEDEDRGCKWCLGEGWYGISECLCIRQLWLPCIKHLRRACA